MGEVEGMGGHVGEREGLNDHVGEERIWVNILIFFFILFPSSLNLVFGWGATGVECNWC